MSSEIDTMSRERTVIELIEKARFCATRLTTARPGGATGAGGVGGGTSVATGAAAAVKTGGGATGNAVALGSTTGTGAGGTAVGGSAVGVATVKAVAAPTTRVVEGSTFEPPPHEAATITNVTETIETADLHAITGACRPAFTHTRG